MSEMVPQTQDIPPKRQRMLDMILVLGGLKEETAIPLSKVSEEIANLKKELLPLTEEILSFPEKYFEKFFIAIEKKGIIEKIEDESVLQNAIKNLEKAVANFESKSLLRFLELLKKMDEMRRKVEDKQEEPETEDVSTILEPLPNLLVEIEEKIQDCKKKAQEETQQAEAELQKLTLKLAEITAMGKMGLEEKLAALQKLGTATRYGPFLRLAAQLKRGRREGRISESRLQELVEHNLIVELQRGIIFFILKRMGAKTVPQLAELIRTTPEKVQHAIISMIQRDEVKKVGLEKDAPVFAVVMGTQPETTLVIKKVYQQFRRVQKLLSKEAGVILQKNLEKLATILDQLQKLGMYEQEKFAEPVNNLRKIADQSTETVLRQSKTIDTEELALLISAGLEAFARFRLKIALEKGPNLVAKENVYGEKLDPEVYKRILDTYLENEIERGAILILIREHGAMTVKELSVKTKIPPDRVLQHVLRMKRDELLTVVGEKQGYVLYDVPRTLNEAEITIQTVCDLANELSFAKAELSVLISDLKAQEIGRLVMALETFSKARDKLLKVTIDGKPIAEDILRALENTIKTAVGVAYRTRARIPSTRPKVTIEDLIEVDVPSVMDEYKEMMGYAPLLGFGTIEWDVSKCLGCRSCEIACPENAIKLKPIIELPKFFEFTDEVFEKLPANRALFYKTLQGLATKKPVHNIVLTRDVLGFGHIEVDLWLCVACRTCIRRCPGPENGALELELKWNLPEVVKHITASEQ